MRCKKKHKLLHWLINALIFVRVLNDLCKKNNKQRKITKMNIDFPTYREILSYWE